MKSWLFFAGVTLLPLLSSAQGLVNNGATITVQAGALLYVASAVQNTAGSTLLNAGTLQITGDLTNAGTFTSTGNLQFSGSTDQTFAPGGASVTTLTQANSGIVGNNRLLIPADPTVSATLALTRGLVRTQSLAAGSTLYTLSLPDGGRVTGEASRQYVQGRLAVTRTSVAAGAGLVDFTHGFVLTPGSQNLGPVT